MSYMLRRTLLSKIGLFICLVMAAAGVTADRESHISLAKPLPQPDWELPLIANGSGTLSDTDLHGRVTYLDFWASWCGPCRLSLPALNRLRETFSSEAFNVVAISVDYVEEDALDFLARYPVAYPIAIDTTGDSGRAFAVAGMPSGYLIDKKGMIREIHVGFRKGDEVILQERIAALLAESD